MSWFRKAPPPPSKSAEDLTLMEVWNRVGVMVYRPQDIDLGDAMKAIARALEILLYDKVKPL